MNVASIRAIAETPARSVLRAAHRISASARSAALAGGTGSARTRRSPQTRTRPTRAATFAPGRATATVPVLSAALCVALLPAPTSPSEATPRPRPGTESTTPVESGVTLDPRSLTIDEGGSATYTVVLDRRPAGDVRIRTWRPGSGVSLVPAGLRFTPENWNTPQTVTVRPAQDDDAVDGSIIVSHTAKGGGYGELACPRLRITVIDDDTRRLVLSATKVTIAEGASGSYRLRLGSEPTGPVTVSVTGSADGNLTVTPRMLDFTAWNWSRMQTVTVMAAFDADGEDDEVTLRHSAVGADYAAADAREVAVNVVDTFAVRGTAGSVAASSADTGTPPSNSR